MAYPEPDDEERTRIPAPILEQVIHLQWDLTELGCNWDLIDQIYGDEEDRKLLSRASTYGYGAINRMLIDHCILYVARLTDPPKSAGKDNLNFLSLKKCLGEHGDQELILQTEGSFSKLVDHAQECRTYRHKALAHSDFDTALGISPQPSVRIGSINSFIEVGRQIVNDVREYFEVRHFCFDMVVGADASGVTKSLRSLRDFRELWSDAHNFKIPDDAELRQRLLQIRPS